MEKIPKTISYSGLMMWHNCPKLYYINYILGEYISSTNLNTIFGSLIHNCVQQLLTKKINKEQAVCHLGRVLDRLFSLYKKYIDLEKYSLAELKQCGTRMLSEIESVIESEFKNYKVVGTEINLLQTINENFLQKFNGYVDIVFETEDHKFIIADFKVVNSMFYFFDSKDKYKDYQLTLYKHFYSKQFNIDPKDIETYFIVLEKNSKAKKMIIIERITSGNKKIENALALLNNALRNINNCCMWIKNKSFCEKYKGNPCLFKGSEFCK